MAQQHRTLAEDYLAAAGSRTPYTSMPEITHRHASTADPRPGWDDLAEDLRADLTAEGEKAAGKDWPQILASDYMEFSRTGNRVHFEDKYFRRRCMLTSLVMAECAENRGRYMGKITDGLYLILEETTWCLPPHNGYIRDSIVYPLPDHARPVIDLFAAETAAIVGVAEYLLRPVLAQISPFISRYVNETLRSRIVTPYLSYHFWWMGGEGQMLNWTPWITQNVLLAVATRPENTLSEEEREAILQQVAKSVDYFLDEYGDDGCCSEGAQYYTHAGLCLYGCLHLISELTKTASESFSRIFQEPLIGHIATYIVNMYVGDHYYINFADCSPFPGRRTARDFLFAKAVGSEPMASFCAEDFRNQTRQERLDPEEENLWYHVLSAFTSEEMLQYPKTAAMPQDVWYPSNGIMIARAALPADAEDQTAGNPHTETKTWAGELPSTCAPTASRAEQNTYVLAAKAGNNADAHNHNDVGSVTLYKNSRPYLIDLGVETYTAKTFSADRYDIWTMQSQYHNLPTFLADPAQQSSTAALHQTVSGSGSTPSEAMTGNTPSRNNILRYDLQNCQLIQQKDGAAYAAKNISCRLGSDTSVLTEDIAAAYPDPRIRSYVRTVTLQKTPSGTTAPVTIEDHYDGSLPCVVSLMTYEKPELYAAENPVGKDTDHTTPARIQVGTLGYITATGASRIEIQTCPIQDPRLSIAWKHACYRILLYMKKDTLHLRIH